jgi:phosphatidylinositol glycan class V
MLACTRNQWTRASLYFALATTVRSNGILLSGFIIWGLTILPFVLGQAVTRFLPFESIVFNPCHR